MSHLTYRQITEFDADFIFRLYNSDGFKRFIGDKNLKTTDDAVSFIQNNLLPMYENVGMGLLLVIEKTTSNPIGICGLIKRDTLSDVDLGYGFLPQVEGKGYAYEATQHAIAYARETLHLEEIVAICTSHNVRSQKLLHRLQFEYQGVQEKLEDGIDLELYRLKL